MLAKCAQVDEQVADMPERGLSNHCEQSLHFSFLMKLPGGYISRRSFGVRFAAAAPDRPGSPGGTAPSGRRCRGAEAIWQAATDANAPLRIPAGADAVQWMTGIEAGA